MAQAKQDFDGRILPTILDFNVSMDDHLASKANFLFGAATFILVFVLNKVLDPGFVLLYSLIKISWVVLLVGSFFSMLASMMIVLPKLRIFSKKERIKEDVLYYKNILSFYSRDGYMHALQDLPLNNKRIGAAYANQIYSLATNILPYKFKLLKIAGWTLVVSILISTLLFLVSIIP